jgi:peptidoglycan/xylan/chitin deacetylase (PgdA/CDA1 family)
LPLTLGRVRAARRLSARRRWRLLRTFVLLVALVAAGRAMLVNGSDEAGVAAPQKRAWATASPKPPAVNPATAVHLTFDDGPQPVFTPLVLDLLRAARMRATFFATGRQVRAHPELAARIVAEGHSLQNHSDSHPDLTQLGPAALDAQISRAQDAIVAATKVSPRCLRVPYAKVNPQVTAAAARYGLTLVGWTVDTRDWARPGATAIAARTVAGLQRGAIVLMHDGGGDRSQTVAALRTVLATLAARGLTSTALCM